MPPLIATASPVALRPAAGLPAFALLISCWKRVFDCCVRAKQPRAGDTQRRARIAVLIVCMIASFCSFCFFDNKSTKNIRVTTPPHPLFCKSKGSDGQNKGSKRQSKGSDGQSKGSDGQSKGSKRQLPPCGCPLAVAANMWQKFLWRIYQKKLKLCDIAYTLMKSLLYLHRSNVSFVNEKVRLHQQNVQISCKN